MRITSLQQKFSNLSIHKIHLNYSHYKKMLLKKNLKVRNFNLRFLILNKGLKNKETLLKIMNME